MSELKLQLETAVNAGKLDGSSASNILLLLSRSKSEVYSGAVQELVAGAEWSELNDRFFRTLAFGTGGLRGRTIGKIVTSAEQGNADPATGCPEHPCVGSNAMNFYNISRATQGLIAYLKEWLSAAGSHGKPRIAIAHDTRFFSRGFAEFAARIGVENGCDVFLFAEPRSTPELSFAVRQTGSHAGIVITASHNPSHDNGYKVYFGDGAQVIEPHAGGIIEKVNAVQSEVYEPLPLALQGKLVPLGTEMDDAYMTRLETLVLDPDRVRACHDLRIVYTPIHGTGAAIIKPMLARLGFACSTVAAQETPDGRFPTVKSPNPENAEALSLAVAQARNENAGLVIATDPDDDRMAVAARTEAGDLELLTGNQIGSLMAWYRASTLIGKGIITPENRARAVIIKTFVTTDLQKAIADKLGLRCVETLTGFKYIGAKLAKYEAALPEAVRLDYRRLSEDETRTLRLAHSAFYVFGGEESYGYSGADFVRDKDGNSAAVMFAEVAAYAKSRGLTIPGLLDAIYSEFGFYDERSSSMTFDGAEGAAKIKKLAQSYSNRPPRVADGVPVERSRNFATETFHDVEGDPIPPEGMLIFELNDGRRVAVRPSGTEPKIKFYLFGHRPPPAGGKLDLADLPGIKRQVGKSLETLWTWLQADAEERLAE